MAEELANQKKWYVVRTQGGKEQKAKEYIEEEISNRKLGNQVTQVLIPTEKYYQVKNGKRVSAERIFFPGYVLVEAKMSPEIQHIISDITFVAGFLSSGKDKVPVPMRQAEIDRIMGHVDALASQDEDTVTPFVVGEAVKIMDGPFSGFDGTVEEVVEDKRKLLVMVKIFGRKTPLELNFAQVTKELN